MNGSRPPRPQHLLLEDGLWSLVMACLITAPSQRPTAEQIAEALVDGEVVTSTLPAVDSIVYVSNANASIYF